MADTAALARSDGHAIFGADAACYRAGRLGYPGELYDLVARVARDILELSPGTGLVTEALLARDVRRVVAVEPSLDLVAFARDGLPDPRLTLVAAAFPDGEIAGGFDLAVCAAAFHWMEPVAALARVRALLVPGGR